MPLLFPGNSPAIRILMYHHVGPYPRADRQDSLYLHTERFAQQMDYLARASVSVISMDDAVLAINGQVELDKTSVVLSFDDGFQDFNDYAWPILQSHGFPAINYAIVKRLGRRSDWVNTPAFDYGNELMDAVTLRKLADAGLEIGGHTATHPHLSRLDREQLQFEIAAAKQQLEDVLGRQVNHFCYPFGDYDSDVCDEVYRSGFKSAVTTIRTRADRAPNIYEIPRIRIKYNNSLMEFRHKTRSLHCLTGKRKLEPKWNMP